MHYLVFIQKYLLLSFCLFWMSRLMKTDVKLDTLIRLLIIFWWLVNQFAPFVIFFHYLKWTNCKFAWQISYSNLTGITTITNRVLVASTREINKLVLRGIYNNAGKVQSAHTDPARGSCSGWVCRNCVVLFSMRADPLPACCTSAWEPCKYRS